MRHNKFVASMESINEDNTHGPQVEIPLSMDSVESKMLEVGQAERRTITAMEEVEETLSDIDTLERIQNNMMDSVEEGGLTPEAAEMAEIAVESIMARFGIKKTSVNGIASLESFEKQHTRVIATKLSVESIGETIKKGWERVIEMLKKAYQWVVEFVKNMIASSSKLIKRAEEIKKAANSIGSDKSPKNTTVKAGPFVNQLAFRDGFTAAGVVEGMRVTEESVDVTARAYKVLANMYKYYTSLTTQVGEYVDLTEVSPSEKLAMTQPAGWTEVDGNGFVVLQSPRLPGNRCIQITSDKEILFKYLPFIMRKVEVVPYSKSDKRIDEDEVEVAQQDDIVKISQYAVNTLKAVESKRSELNGVYKDMNKAIATLNQMANVSVNGSSPTLRSHKKQLAEVRDSAVLISNLTTSVIVTVNKVAMTVSRHALDYCEVSLKQYA